MSDVTKSGNEITDASRILAVEGDGIDAAAKRDGSCGIWEASTNLVTNGGFETDTTGWVESGATITRDVAEAQFGSASGEFVTANAAANEGGYHVFTGAAATQYTVSAWVWGTGTVHIALYDDVSGKQASSAVTLSATPQRVTKTATTGGGSATFRVYVETNTQQDITFNVDGVQVEVQPIATPYIETDGGTAGRNAGRVQMPASLIDETQGWIAIRVRMAYTNNGLPVTNPWFWIWGDGINDRLGGFLSADSIHFRRANGGAGVSSALSHGGFSLGDRMTFIFWWSATHQGMSVNGGSLSSSANANVPTLSATTFDVGCATSVYADAEFDCDFLWVACGTGTLTDAIAAAIYALDDGVYPCDFPAIAVVTACWNADNDSYHEPEENIRTAELAVSVK